MKTPTSLRKRLPLAMLLLWIGAWLSSCIIVTDYGPNGQPGKAFFGIDYDMEPPYSYWDNNPNVPDAPFFGEYYRTTSGVYSFEYFVNPFDYWYGTYRISINPGSPGQLYGEPGADGADTYLMLICNEDGFYFEHWDDCSCIYRNDDGTMVIEFRDKDHDFRIEMKKSNILERPPTGTPKYQR